jgi:hypothetical protein
MDQVTAAKLVEDVESIVRRSAGRGPRENPAAVPLSALVGALRGPGLPRRGGGRAGEGAGRAAGATAGGRRAAGRAAGRLVGPGPAPRRLT